MRADWSVLCAEGCVLTQLVFVTRREEMSRPSVTGLGGNLRRAADYAPFRLGLRLYKYECTNVEHTNKAGSAGCRPEVANHGLNVFPCTVDALNLLVSITGEVNEASMHHWRQPIWKVIHSSPVICYSNTVKAVFTLQLLLTRIYCRYMVTFESPFRSEILIEINS